MEETKRCPYCGEEIFAVAKKCKHCGEWMEQKEPEKEKKACPVCGELIDEGLKICPYCKEQTHFEENMSVGLSQESVNGADNNQLYCKSCKSKMHIDSESCNGCGDKDPFYFKRIKRFGTISCGGAIVVSFILLYISNEYMGFRLSITPAWLEFICFAIIYFILASLFTVLIRRLLFHSFIMDYERIMKSLFEDMGNPSAIDSWNKKVDDIL